MNKLFLTLGLILSLSVTVRFSYGQAFEGKIVYESSFISKIKGFSDGQLEALIGAKQEYFIKGGYYKSLLNGQSLTKQLYDCKANRLYNQKRLSDTLYWVDASINIDSLVNYEIKKNADTVLGLVCDAIIMTTKASVTTFYYNSKYKIGYELYINHHYGNWAFYTEKAKSVPLKMVIETSLLKIVSTAIEIKPVKLEGDCFNIDLKRPIKRGV
jgi:hypothetical protein